MPFRTDPFPRGEKIEILELTPLPYTKEEMQAYWNNGVEKDNPGLSKAE